MHRHFEEVERELKDRIVAMGTLAEEMVRSSVQGLAGRDKELLLKVARNEEQVNRLHIEVDNSCLNLIALYQPAAADLRFIVAAIKINSDLERIGDQAVNISQTAGLLLSQPRLERELPAIPRMAELAQSMLRDSLEAFVKKDVEQARRVLAGDAEEDRLKSESFNELMRLMQSDASTIQRALGFILVARNLERIADHATNIAEDVIFMTLGRDIRHHAEENKAGA